MRAHTRTCLGGLKEWREIHDCCVGLNAGLFRGQVVPSAGGSGKNTHQVTYLDCQRELAHTAANVCRICLDARALCGPLLIENLGLGNFRGV